MTASFFSSLLLNAVSSCARLSCCSSALCVPVTDGLNRLRLARASEAAPVSSKLARLSSIAMQCQRVQLKQPLATIK